MAASNISLFKEKKQVEPQDIFIFLATVEPIYNKVRVVYFLRDRKSTRLSERFEDGFDIDSVSQFISETYLNDKPLHRLGFGGQIVEIDLADYRELIGMQKFYSYIAAFIANELDLSEEAAIFRGEAIET